MCQPSFGTDYAKNVLLSVYRSNNLTDGVGSAMITDRSLLVKSDNGIVENIVNDIDNVVRIVRFPGWQDVPSGRREVRKEILKIVRIKYKIKDEDVLKKTYEYVEQYYSDGNES